MRVLLACVLLCAAAAVMAGAPTVDRSTALFDQNGGTLTINGSGFVRDNPYSQFLFILRNQNGDVWVSNPAGVIDDVTTTPRMGAAVDLGQGITDGGWRGCVPNSLSVNAAGTKATCTLEYIPDTVLEIAGAGITSVEVDVFNSNGYLALPDPAVGVTVAVINNVNEQIFPGSSTVPPILHGITVIGVGFPAAGSIFLTAGGFSLTLSSFDLAPTTINVIGGSDIQPQDNILTHAAAFVSVTASGNIEVDPAIADTDAFTAGNCECWYDRNRIDCGFCGTALDAALPGTMTPNQALIAQLSIQSFSTVAPPMVIGPTQIATVSAVFRPPGSVTVDVDTTTEYFWNSPELVITGSGFATFPALHSNLILVPGALAGDPVDPTGTLVPARASPFKCIPTSVNADGTRLTCALQTLEPTATGTDVTVPLRVIVVSGESYSFTNDPVDGAIATQIGEITFVDTATIQSIAIDPRSAGIQQDARTLTLTSGNGLFGPSWPILYNDPALTIDAATLPTVVLNEVTLTGIESGASTVCTHQFSQNPEALVTIGGPPLPRVCTILSATNSEIRLSLPPINEPVGTTVTALINYDFRLTATAAFDTDVQVVGVISPGAGVGGDPHFFGFLGEKYEFAGEAGEVYNILTDEEVQLNAVIGKWHFSHGEETIIKTLALKTASHRLLIDAGGNHLGTAGFSIQLDGVALEPNATDATSLGRDGWVRWNPLSEEDQFHLPLWERHHGVALVEVMLNDYHFQILSVEEGRDANGVWRKQPSRFLDFMCQMFDADRRPHGLFGQSAHLPAGKRSVEGWSLEGADSDYKVTEVFGDDFTFNKFQS
jgi:hypothetical protein